MRALWHKSRLCLAVLASTPAATHPLGSNPPFPQAEIDQQRITTVLLILQNIAARLAIPCPSALATLRAGPRGWANTPGRTWPSRNLWPACLTLIDWALDAAHPSWRVGRAATEWASREQCADHWNILFYSRDGSLESTACCALCSRHFTPPWPHALNQHIRRCPHTRTATIWPTAENVSAGRGSLLTCGDIEENPGPVSPSQLPPHTQLSLDSWPRQTQVHQSSTHRPFSKTEPSHTWTRTPPEHPPEASHQAHSWAGDHSPRAGMSSRTLAR